MMTTTATATDMAATKASMTSTTAAIIAQVAEGPEGEAVCRQTFSTRTMMGKKRDLFGHIYSK